MAETSLCVHHHLPFAQYCESCEQPVCTQCLLLGPHNSEVHAVASLENAARVRRNWVHMTLREVVVPKAKEVEAQLKELQMVSQQTKQTRQALAMEARTFLDGIRARHDQQLQRQLVGLAVERTQAQASLNRLNDLGRRVELLSKVESQEGCARLILQSKGIERGLQEALAEGGSAEKVRGQCFSRELTGMRHLLSEERTMLQLIDLKEQVIGQLYALQEEEVKGLTQQWRLEDEQIKREWAPVVGSMRCEIERSLLVCAFCGTAMAPAVLNSECLYNKNLDKKPSLSSRPKFKFFTAAPPQNIYLGTGWHHFAPPAQFRRHPILIFSPDWRDSRQMVQQEGQLNPFEQFLQVLAVQARDGIRKLPNPADLLDLRYFLSPFLSELQLQYLAGTFAVSEKKTDVSALKEYCAKLKQ